MCLCVFFRLLNVKSEDVDVCYAACCLYTQLRLVVQEVVLDKIYLSLNTW